MQAKGKVTPDEKNEEDLAVPGPGIDPKIGDFVRVIDVDAGQDARAAGIDDVHEQKIGDRQSNEDLTCLPRWHSVVSTADESSEAAKRVYGQTSVKKYLAGRGMPERHHPRPRRLLRLQGDKTERVIRQVHRDIKTNDEAAGG